LNLTEVAERETSPIAASMIPFTSTTGPPLALKYDHRFKLNLCISNYWSIGWLVFIASIRFLPVLPIALTFKPSEEIALISVFCNS
jgi:hypothetical protein